MNNLFSFNYRCLIPFHLTDAAGKIFFGHVFSLAHQAFEHFILEHVQIPWTFWFKNPDWLVPIKHVEAEYMVPLRAGDYCQIELQIISLTTSSFTLSSSFYQSQLCCVVKSVHVFCSLQTGQKIPIPPPLLPTLTQHLTT